MPYLTPMEEIAMERGIEKGIESERRSLLEAQLLARFGERVRPSLAKLGTLGNETLLELAKKVVTIRDDEEFLDELRQVFLS